MTCFRSCRWILPLAAALLAGWAGVGMARVVTTESGQVSGTARNGALEYRGIPYAAAPAGALRWALPQPPAPWQGVRDASRFGPACPQQARFGLTDSSLDEDCLSLNVSVPADLGPAETLPVLVWIHGGAFVGGASELYRLDRLASRGRLVVVSMNYRLGLLGFMPHPAFETPDHVNGNYGLEDQRAALRWVRRNIAAFGGDPASVTIAGESAGAGSICMHLASAEKVEGLFQRAIVMSGGCLQDLKTVAEAEVAGRALVESLGCRGDRDEVLRCLRGPAMSVERLLKAQGDYAAANPLDLLAFSPVVGTRERPNATVPRTMRESLQSDRVVAVPLLIGGASHEVRLYLGYWWQDWKAGKPHAIPVSAAGFEPWLRRIYPGSPAGSTRSHADRVREAYQPAGGWASDRQAAETLGTLLSDYSAIPINHCNFLMATDAFAAYAARSGRPLRVHHFEFADADAPVAGVGIAPPYPDFTLGAVHSSIINYVFPGYDNSRRIAAPDLPSGSRTLADQVTDSWTRFAKSGNPGGADLPDWPPYASAGARTMRFAPERVALHDAAAVHRCAFWRGLYPERLR